MMGNCTERLHANPLPTTYDAARDERRRRRDEGWIERRCPMCSQYGWVLPDRSRPVETHSLVPQPVSPRTSEQENCTDDDHDYQYIVDGAGELIKLVCERCGRNWVIS